MARDYLARRYERAGKTAFWLFGNTKYDRIVFILLSKGGIATRFFGQSKPLARHNVQLGSNKTTDSSTPAAVVGLH